MRKLLILAGVMLATAAYADDQAPEWNPAFLHCTFTQSAFSSHHGPEVTWMKDELFKVGEDRMESVFAGIDLAANRAQLAGNVGSASVWAYRGAFNSIVFLEVTPVGNMNMTTVLSPEKDGTIRAITSRHTVDVLPGEYMATQMLGTCTVTLGELKLP